MDATDNIQMIEEIPELATEFFCFSEDCKGTNYKNEITSKKCLEQHAQCVLSNVDVVKQALLLQDIKKVHEHRNLKNKIDSIKIDLDEISRDLDSVFFIQYLPQLMKEDVIKVSTEFLNYFSFDNYEQYKELKFTAQFEIVDRVLETFSQIGQHVNKLIQKTKTIKQESLKEEDTLIFSQGDFKVLANAPLAGNKGENAGNCKTMQYKSQSTTKSLSKKKAIKKLNKEEGGISYAEQRKKTQKILKVQKKTEETRMKSQELQKKKNLNSQIQYSNLENIDDNKMAIVQEQKIINQNHEKKDEHDQLIVLDDDDYEEEEIGQLKKQALNTENEKETNFLQFNSQSELQINQQDQLKFSKILKSQQDEQKNLKQIMYIQESQTAQDLNAHIFCLYDQEIQNMKLKFKQNDTYISESLSEQLFSTVKKSQIHEFEKILYLVKLQNDGHLTITSIKNKIKQECYKSDISITDFYSFIDIQEGVIYLITLKQSLYKILTFNIQQNKNQYQRTKQLYSKNLNDSNIVSISHLTYESSSRDRIVNILLQTPKCLMIQEGVNQFNEFSDFKIIFYSGYIYFSKLFSYNNEIYYAIAGIDNTLSLYNSKCQIKKVIQLQKHFTPIIDVIQFQISDEILLLVQKQGLFLYNLNQSQQPLINPKCIAQLQNIESVYIKDIYLYVLHKNFNNEQIKKYCLSDFRRISSNIKQESYRND
ncbi:hypothetical protein TTHERM_00137950 (macronuclear) [Tetrahymena thermophila SB210]|uniref:Uncharacterized protein n=1 Tax=Tetrahymena thermophila (strain SB210) TaxID=312017 RepID=I7MKL9_TETTS|nr:hypothetical protein TTHERM_00137950 [Tetrahymena thermophila SB210]EAR99532.2 hypothetical protein TTHERM_00137950 [Tetrahymena thermophila SB210]|eukprot:XP_001019777.2 hypothetical protein TTHERM_00137950 [Tetrahymena thermophila SB210]